MEVMLVTIKSMGKNGEVKFPCTLYEGNHPIHLFPYMDEASKLLDNLTTSQRHLLTSYQKLSPDPPLVHQVIDHNSYLAIPTHSECESHEPIPN